jgi:hypothetical protein
VKREAEFQNVPFWETGGEVHPDTSCAGLEGKGVEGDVLFREFLVESIPEFRESSKVEAQVVRVIRTVDNAFRVHKVVMCGCNFGQCRKRRDFLFEVCRIVPQGEYELPEGRGVFVENPLDRFPNVFGVLGDDAGYCFCGGEGEERKEKEGSTQDRRERQGHRKCAPPFRPSGVSPKRLGFRF